MPIIDGQWVEPTIHLRKELEGSVTLEQPISLPAIAGLVDAELTADNVIAFLELLASGTTDASNVLRLAAFSELEELLSPRLTLKGQLALDEIRDDIFYQ